MSCILDGGMVSDLCYTPRSVILWMIWTGFAPNLSSLIWSIYGLDTYGLDRFFYWVRRTIRVNGTCCLQPILKLHYLSLCAFRIRSATNVVLKTVEFRLHSAGQSPFLFFKMPKAMKAMEAMKKAKKAAAPAPAMKAMKAMK